jgi:hypothetical protein
MDDAMIVLQPSFTLATPNPTILAKRLASGTYRFEEDGLYKRCCRCRSYWPADTEFFNKSAPRPDGLHEECRACQADEARLRWQKQKEAIKCEVTSQ